MNPDLLEQLRLVLGGGTPSDATRVAPRRDLYGPPLQGPPQPVMSAAPVLRSNVEEAPGLGRALAEMGAAMVSAPIDAALTGRDVARNLAQGEYAQAIGNTAMGVGGAMLAGNPFMALGRGARRAAQVFGTHEAVPGKGVHHLAGLLQASPGAREEFSALRQWRLPDDRDMLFDIAGLNPKRTRAGTGLYEGEFNPLEIARADLPLTGAGVNAINTVEGTRALMDAQNAGAWSSVAADAAGTGLRLPMNRPMDPAQLDALNKIAGNWEGGAVDTGRGVTILGWGNPSPSQMLAQLQSALSGVPLAGRPYAADINPNNYFSLFEKIGPGGMGEATRVALGNADPALLARIGNDPRFLERIDRVRQLDAQDARQFGRQNPLIDNARRIASQPGGLSRLYQMVKNNQGIEQLPAMALLTGGAGLSAYGQNEDVGEGLAGASLAGMLGMAARPVGEAWHGSPQRGINQFQRSREGMTGQGVYVARNDPLGAGQKQALGYATPGLGYVNVGGRAILPMDAKKIEEALGRNVGDETLLALDDALFMARKRMGLKDYPRGMGFADPSIFGRYRSTLRSHWLDALSEMTDRYKGRGMSPAQQGAQLVAAGDIDVNRPGMYRLWVDADNERMLNFDMGLNEQPEFVRNALLSSNDPRIAAAVQRAVQDSRAQSSMGTVAGSPDFVPDGRMIFRRMESEIPDPQKLRETLEAMGLEGVQASGGTYPVRSASSAPGTPDWAESTQYSIFNPERIRILEALAAAGILPAANALAKMREEQATAPEG